MLENDVLFMLLNSLPIVFNSQLCAASHFPFGKCRRKYFRNHISVGMLWRSNNLARLLDRNIWFGFTSFTEYWDCRRSVFRPIGIDGRKENKSIWFVQTYPLHSAAPVARIRNIDMPTNCGTWNFIRILIGRTLEIQFPIILICSTKIKEVLLMICSP